MKISYSVIALLLFVSLQTSYGQEQVNAFLQRSYWKANPSIDQIKEDMAKGHSVFEANRHGFDATTYAILEKADLVTVKFLIDQGNSVNKLTHDARNYIFWAAYKGNLPLMKYLRKKGSNLKLIDQHGYSLITFAATTGQEDLAVYDFCLKNGSDLINEKNRDGANSLLLFLGRSGKKEVVDYFLEKGLSLQSKDDSGNNAFNYAAKSGNLETLKYLYDQGVKPVSNAVSGENAIFFASKNSKNDLAYYQYIESLGVYPNVVNKEGVTPLHNLASSTKDTEVISYFLKKGVDINAKNESGNTALISSSYRNNLEIVTFLVENGADINQTNKQGVSAVARAIRSNSLEVVDYLISKGADLNVTDKEGNNLTYYLIKSFRKGQPDKFNEKLKLLTENGLDIKNKQKDGSTVFHIAVQGSSLDLLEIINTFEVDINAIDANGHTALHYAAMKSNNDQMLRYLISIGANTKIKTQFDETAFDLAKENELLTKNNIDINFLNEE